MIQPKENAQPKLRLTPDAAPTPGERAMKTITRPKETAAPEDDKRDSAPDTTQSGSSPSESPGSHSRTGSGEPKRGKTSSKGSGREKLPLKTDSPLPPVYLGRRQLRVNLNARVLPHNKEMLDEICHRMRISQQQFVEDALEDAFSKHGSSYDKLFAA